MLIFLYLNILKFNIYYYYNCSVVNVIFEFIHHTENIGKIYPKDFLLKQENTKAGLAQGQIIAIGTDGIWETFNKQGEMFGKRRFRESIRKNAYMGSNEILNAVFNEIDIFSKGLKKKDDITLVIIKIEETSEEGVDWHI